MSINNNSITAMTAAHLDAVAALEALCFSTPWSRSGLEAELDNPLAVFLVSEVNGSIAGYCGAHFVFDEGFITNVAVHPDFRGRGIGAALVQELCAHARAAQLATLTLEVRPANTAAINLYTRAGFLPVGRRKNFYIKPTEDALLMTLTLSPTENP